MILAFPAIAFLQDHLIDLRFNSVFLHKLPSFLTNLKKNYQDKRHKKILKLNLESAYEINNIVSIIKGTARTSG